MIAIESMCRVLGVEDLTSMSDDDDQRFNNYSMPTPTQSQSSLSFISPNIPNQISDTAIVVTDSSNNKRKRRSSSTSLPQQHQPMKFKKAPGAPRRFKSAFIFYSTQKHKEIRSSLGKAGAKEKTTNVAKMVSEAWKKLEPEEREYWEDMARKDKERYELEKSIYNGPWKVPAEKAVKDPNAPKRPMSAFLSYSNSKRSQVKKQFPHLSNAEVSRILANMWKEASDDEKQSFIDHEYKLRQQYKVAIAEWRANAQHEKHYERLQREEMALQTLEAHKQLKEGGGDKGNGTSSSSSAAGVTDGSDPSLSLRAMLIERQRKQQREREREQRERQQREREEQQQQLQQEQNVNEASSPSHASSNNLIGQMMSGASTGNNVMPESLSSSHLDQQQPFMDGLSPSWASSSGGGGSSGYGVGYGGYGSHSHHDPSGFYGSPLPMGYPHHHSHSSSSHLLPGSSMEASSSLSSYMGGGSNIGNVFDYGYHHQQHQHYHNQAGASGGYPPPYSFHHGTTAMSAAPWSSSRDTGAASASVSASASFGNGSLSDMHDNQHNQHANGGYWGSAGVGVGTYASYPLTDGGYYGSGSGAMPNNDQQSYASRHMGAKNTAVATDANDEEDYVRSSNTDDNNNNNNNNKNDNNYLGGIFDASSSNNNQNDDNFP